jgi:hypothetical protein
METLCTNYWTWSINDAPKKSKRGSLDEARDTIYSGHKGNPVKEPVLRDEGVSIDMFNKSGQFETMICDPSNKRTENSERLSDREMIIQTNINPFLAKNSYIDDIEIQDTILRPKDSNYRDDTNN